MARVCGKGHSFDQCLLTVWNGGARWMHTWTPPAWPCGL
jgi:hypothetical protein